jgi:hypothetical protein
LNQISAWINDWSAFQNRYSDLPFFLLHLKLPYIIFDFLIGYLLYRLTNKKSLFLLWIYNPVTLYLIYILGNFDVIPSFLTLLAYYLIRQDKRRLAFLSLGLAIALKLYPLIFLPFLLFTTTPRLSRLFKESLLALLPLLISIIPFVNSPSFFHSFFGSGLTQKIFEFRFYFLPLFPAFYSLLFLLYLYWQKRRQYSLPLEIFILPLFLGFVGLVSFHPQWIIWFFPFILPLFFSNRFSRFTILFSLVLIFTYIALFKDEFLFWGHLLPIDPDFQYLTQPHVLFEKFLHYSSIAMRSHIHLVLTSLALLTLPYKIRHV